MQASGIENKDLVDSNNTRRYYYNYRWQVLCEYNGSDEFQQWYAYGNYIDEVLAMGAGIFASTARFYIHDHLYSPVALTDYSGNVLERYEYDAYGNVKILDASYETRETSNYNNPYYFTGRELDFLDSGILKIMYHRNRFYDTYTGRFTSHDPQGYIDGINLYEYALCNPAVYSDPYGHFGLLPKIKDLDWKFTGGCYPTGHATISINLGTPKWWWIKFFSEVDFTFTGTATLDWTSDYKEDCHTQWSPWTVKVLKTEVDLWPIWDAHSDYIGHGFAPDLDVYADLHSEMFFSHTLNWGVKFNTHITSSVVYKRWIESKCMCARLTYDTDISGDGKQNVGGIAAAIAVIVGIAAEGPAIIEFIEEFFRNLPNPYPEPVPI